MKKAIGNLEWDEKRSELHFEFCKLMGVNTDPSFIQHMVNIALNHKYILDERLDLIERIEGLTSTSLIKGLENSLSGIYIDAMQEGFEPEEVNEYILHKVKEAYKNKGIILNEGFEETEDDNTETEEHELDIISGDLDDTLNSKLTHHGTEVMEKNNARLGTIIATSDGLKIGQLYCILDQGTNEWIPGYKYMGYLPFSNTTAHFYTFKNTLDPHALGEDDMYTQEEVIEMVKNNQIRYQDEQ